MKDTSTHQFEVMNKARNLYEAALLAYHHEYSPFRDRYVEQFEKAKAELSEAIEPKPVKREAKRAA